MADYGFNTQLTPNIPQTSLSDMMNLARGAQAYQQASQVNPLALRQQAAQTSLAEQTLQPEVEAKTAQASTATTGAQKAKFDYAMKHANSAIQQMQTIINKPDLNENDVRNLITENVNSLNGPPEAIDLALRGMPKNGTPTQYRSFVAQKQMSMLDTLQQLEKMYPGAVMTTEGATMTPRQMGNPMLTGVAAGTAMGPSIETTLQPGQTMDPTGRTDVNGNPTAYVKNASGKILGEVTIPAGVNQPPAGMPSNKPAMPAMQGNQPAMPANAPVRIRPGESAESYKASSDLRINARQAAAQTPMQQFTANQIIDLADKAQTGVGAETLANLAGKLAIVPWTGNTATYFDNLGHTLALQQVSLAKSAGLSGTDQANQLAGQLSGTTNFTADSIKSTARTNRALSTAASMFNNGIENRFATTKDPLAANDFQSQWSKTADINAIRLHDAIVNKDIPGIKEVIKAVDPQSMKLKDPMQSPNVQFLLKKWDAMNKLVKGQ
jgi:hypothetical protein